MQFLGHVLRPQVCPSNPASHTQTPSKRSQYPLLEHSAGACASSVPFALSDQAGPTGHSMRLQSAPVHPVLQLHWRAEVEPSVEDSHEPCPLQRFGEHGWAVAVLDHEEQISTAAAAVVQVIARFTMLVAQQLYHKWLCSLCIGFAVCSSCACVSRSSGDVENRQD